MEGLRVFDLRVSRCPPSGPDLENHTDRTIREEGNTVLVYSATRRGFIVYKKEWRRGNETMRRGEETRQRGSVAEGRELGDRRVEQVGRVKEVDDHDRGRGGCNKDGVAIDKGSTR